MLMLQHEARSLGFWRSPALPSLLPQVLGDSVQLQHVMMSLTRHGVQDTRTVQPGRPELMVRAHSQAPDQTLGPVEDSGVGVDLENADRLFSPSLTRKPDGMGIGLSICRSIIEDHSGRIWFTRNPGAGSTFQFTLPACGAMPSL